MLPYEIRRFRGLASVYEHNGRGFRKLIERVTYYIYINDEGEIIQVEHLTLAVRAVTHKAVYDGIASFIPRSTPHDSPRRNNLEPRRPDPHAA